MPYAKLIGKMAEQGKTRYELAEDIGLTPPTLKSRLDGKSSWKMSEIYTLCKVLHIEEKEVFDIFFTEKLAKTQDETKKA